MLHRGVSGGCWGREVGGRTAPVSTFLAWYFFICLPSSLLAAYLPTAAVMVVTMLCYAMTAGGDGVFVGVFVVVGMVL